MKTTMITEAEFNAMPEFQAYVNVYEAWERGEATLDAVHEADDRLDRAVTRECQIAGWCPWAAVANKVLNAAKVIMAAHR